MAASATARFSDSHLERMTVPSGGFLANQIVQAPSTRPGVVQSIVPTVEDDTVNVKTDGIYEVPSATGTLFALGATVGWDDTTNLAVAAGTGDFDIGIAGLQKVSGQLIVQVIFGA
jgi:predicted RecA/RadA family phage recombinase